MSNAQLDGWQSFDLNKPLLLKLRNFVVGDISVQKPQREMHS
jgi:hypothetical protein